MKKIDLYFTCLFFILLSSFILIKVDKLYEYNDIHDKEKAISNQKEMIDDLDNKINEYKILINNSKKEDTEWKKKVETIKKYL